MGRLFSKGAVARAEKLLKTIVDAWEVTEDGGLRTTNHGVIFLEGVLLQSMLAGSGLEVRELEYCARKAIRDIAKERVSNVTRLEEIFAEQVRILKASPPTNYCLVTRCHFALKEGQRFEVEVGKAKAKFSHDRPNFDFTEFFAGGVGRVALDRHFPGAYCVIPIRARKPEFALDMGAQHMDAVFGALNYALHFGTLSIINEGGRPLARAFPGAELGLYLPSGEKVDEHALYYTVTPSRVFTSTHDIPDRWERVRSVVLKSRPNETEYYETFFRLYFQCLSDSDADARAMKLWKIAEFLTHPSGIPAKSEEVCARMSAPFGDSDIVRYVFESLMKRRNWAAHNSSYGIRREEVFEAARDLIDRFVWRSASVSEFPTLKHWQAFLELAQGDYSPDELDHAAKALRKRVGDAAAREGG